MNGHNTISWKRQRKGPQGKCRSKLEENMDLPSDDAQEWSNQENALFCIKLFPLMDISPVKSGFRDTGT